jgi:hypothetical protein
MDQHIQGRSRRAIKSSRAKTSRCKKVIKIRRNAREIRGKRVRASIVSDSQLEIILYKNMKRDVFNFKKEVKTSTFI